MSLIYGYVSWRSVIVSLFSLKEKMVEINKKKKSTLKNVHIKTTKV